MRLLKRLAHFMIFEPAAPAQDGLHIGPDRMPHPHAGLLGRLDALARPIHQNALPQAALKWNGGPLFAAVLKLPDETGREMRNQWMIEIPRLPTLKRASPFRDQLALQTRPLCRDLAVHLFHAAVQILEEFRVFFFDARGSALQGFALAAPNERCPFAANRKPGLAVPYLLNPDPIRGS